MASLSAAILTEVPEILETERLRLVATRPGFGPTVNEGTVESHAELRPWMPWAKTVQSVEESERHCRECHAKWHAREMLDYCFYRKGDGFFVGKGGLHSIDWSVPRFEIGYWIRTSCAGSGFATEATLALVGLAARLGAARVQIGSDARNAASRRVAEKSGFALEGIRQQCKRDVDGRLADYCMYARVFPR